MQAKALFVNTILITLFSSASLLAVDPGVGDTTQTEAPQNWHHMDQSSQNFQGISLGKAYQDILKGKKSKTVIVGVIDSGIDIEHEDLKDIIWVNEKEIAGNGIDDDGNGYVDDIHGWNFIGGKDGKHIDDETLELTRLYKKYNALYEDKNVGTLSGKAKKEYAYYLELKEAFEAELQENQMLLQQYEQILGAFQMFKPMLEKELDGKEFNLENISAITSDDEKINQAKGYMEYLLGLGATEQDIKDGVEHFEDQVNYNLNVDFDPRGIVGDDPSNPYEKNYGNNDVKGPDSDHGTHVAGIIGAVRGNDLGATGVADNVRIMVLRAVPNGDERDKDVANAIYYAVNNGAQVINMSFGKGYSPNKKAVDKAVKYAQKKGVLLIHAAGNDGENIDEVDNFPTKDLKKAHSGKLVKNWIEVGATNWGTKSEFVASFSNYGDASVDIFAPGVDIYSTYPENNYQNQQGTSMAAPVVTGVAALLMSYFPDLNYKEVKEILLSSSVKFENEQVNLPGSDEMVNFGKLSTTGGIVNAYNAVKMANEMK
ncbi:MAG: S8 family peptidase [Bacteroidota bacterium]